MRLPDETVRLILHLLVEGNSIRGTARLAGVEKRTVLRILKLAGENCESLLRRKITNVPVADVEVDEARTFVLKKERRKTGDDRYRNDIGDQFVFIALERTSKLVLCWGLGRRTNETTWSFITKLRDATAPVHFQVTSDAFPAYRGAIQSGLHDRVSYAQLIKALRDASYRAGVLPAREDTGHDSGSDNGPPEQGAGLHEPHRTQERHASPVVQAHDAVNLQLQQEPGEPSRGVGASLRVLQSVQGPRIAQGDARDGKRNHGPRLGLGGVDCRIGGRMAKYDGLTAWLRSQKITLTFDQIENIIGNTLPNSASTYRPWWGNESGADSRPCRAWLDAGWEVDSADLKGRTVVFRQSPR